MCEILIKAISAYHPDPETDERGCYKRGYPVVVMEDGHEWGFEERLPKFVVAKIPTVSVSTAQKYIAPWIHPDTGSLILRRREWIIDVDDMPVAAKQKLAASGSLTIKVAAYTGSYDYTWDQVKTFFRNQRTGLTEE